MRISGLGRYALTTEMKNPNRKNCFQTEKRRITTTCRENMQMINKEFSRQYSYTVANNQKMGDGKKVFKNEVCCTEYSYKFLIELKLGWKDG